MTPKECLLRTKSIVVLRDSTCSQGTQQVQAASKRRDRYNRFGAPSTRCCMPLNEGYKQQKRRRVLQEPRGLRRLVSVSAPNET